MAFMEGEKKPKTTQSKAMNIIRKGWRTAVAAIAALAVGYYLLHAGLYDRCSYYDETLVNFCGISTSPNGLVCSGTCSYVRFPLGTAPCGFCVPAWSLYCANAPTPTFVAVSTFVGNCIGPFQVPGESGSVAWECRCPSSASYVFTGMITVGCWCW